jgi:hypothetical protein
LLTQQFSLPPITWNYMAEFLFNSPSIRVFWSAFDPLDLASDSIDPLGFTAGYIVLADQLLPGMTTITTVPRYLSMLCAALREVREAVGDGDGRSTTARRQQLIEKLKLFERAWALACAFAELNPATSGQATEGLRGIRAARKWRDHHSHNKKVTLAFDLLSNQVRYGGIGAYSTFLESLHLADMASLTLRPTGDALAQAFPSPRTYGLDVLHQSAGLSVAGLSQWGSQAHVGALSDDEAKILRQTLQGGEERELDDEIRWSMLRLIHRCDRKGDPDESQLLARCLMALNHSNPLGSASASAPLDVIRSAIRIIEPYERMYQCATFVFDQVRGRATATGRINLDSALRGHALDQARMEMRSACEQFQKELKTDETSPQSAGPRQALQKLGLVDLSRDLAAASSSTTNVARAVLQRHQQVQEGKFDGGLPKGSWIRLESPQSHLAQLTSQRFGLNGSQVRESWNSMPWHPYRTFGARRFIQLCKVM